MNSRLERSSRNKSLSFCIVFVWVELWGWEWAFLVTWSGVGESHDKWCSLLTPSLGYLWLINWSEKETCWRSRGRQRQASVAVPQSGPQASGEREGVRERQPSLSHFCLFPVCCGEKGRQAIHQEWMGKTGMRSQPPPFPIASLTFQTEELEWKRLFVLINERCLSQIEGTKKICKGFIQHSWDRLTIMIAFKENPATTAV